MRRKLVIPLFTDEETPAGEQAAGPSWPPIPDTWLRPRRFGRPLSGAPARVPPPPHLQRIQPGSRAPLPGSQRGRPSSTSFCFSDPSPGSLPSGAPRVCWAGTQQGRRLLARSSGQTGVWGRRQLSARLLAQRTCLARRRAGPCLCPPGARGPLLRAAGPAPRPRRLGRVQRAANGRARCGQRPGACAPPPLLIG